MAWAVLSAAAFWQAEGRSGADDTALLAQAEQAAAALATAVPQDLTRPPRDDLTRELFALHDEVPEALRVRLLHGTLTWAGTRDFQADLVRTSPGLAHSERPPLRVAVARLPDTPLLLELAQDTAWTRTRAEARQRQVVLVAVLLGLLAGIGRDGLSHPLRTARRALVGSLAARIATAGAISVAVAVGTIEVLDARHEQARIFAETGERLLAIAQVGTQVLPVRLHDAVIADPDPDGEAFLLLQHQLRRVQEAASLSSPVYTLRPDGDIVRFVGMTNEQPFIGDPYALRPGVRRTLQGGPGGWEGPYGDAHGMWVSGWAPLIRVDGSIAGVLQVDERVDVLLAKLANARLRRLGYALTGLLAALLIGLHLARGLAAPIRQLSGAARAIGEGKLDARIPSTGDDELGVLAQAMASMAQGLQERERLHDLFGKYMANQVVQQLLDQGEVRLEGELREVTVVLTDIRGYTSLTGSLGAEQIVALLNDYFGVLIDVVNSHGGVIDKFMGDALLCWFGAPVDQPDHRARATLAAATIMHRLEAWNAGRQAQGLARVETGIGLATGQVVVGNIGSLARVEYTAIGDAVNLASRLCGLAGAGEVVASASLAQSVSSAPFAAREPVTVKGVAEPVQTYLLRWQATTPTAAPASGSP